MQIVNNRENQILAKENDNNPTSSKLTQSLQQERSRKHQKSVTWGVKQG